LPLSLSLERARSWGRASVIGATGQSSCESRMPATFHFDTRQSPRILDMAFKFSLGGAKGNKPQVNLRAKAEEEAAARERDEKNALDKVMAEFEEEHGAGSTVLGNTERREAEEDVFVPTGSKRHFTGRQRSMKSGPGTLEPEPLDCFPRPGGPGRLAPQAPSRFGNAAPSGPAASDNSKPGENVFTTVVAKASNLPPSMDPRRLEDLFSEFPSLKVTKVEKIPPQGPIAKGRPTATMKITFDREANARDLDDAMNRLNDKKYLGRGYYLHLDRYLGGRAISTEQRTEPFGARWQAPEVAKGYAPPPDLGGGNRDRDRPREDTERLVITANQPPDLATLRLVHMTIEGVINGGVEFEAGLMNDPQVQEEERFAWLYDQKHPVNRYYRWRLHQIVCDTPNSEIFARQGDWQGPTDPLADEFANHLGAFDADYEDSDEDEDEEKPQQRQLPIGDNYPGRVDNGHGIMSPRSRAMFLWLLTSLPPGSIVADDIAAISVFAVEHAAQGMDEVINMLISNLIEPFQMTQANTRRRTGANEGKEEHRRADLRQVTLNGLRILSDVLLTTSRESGVAYKYRLAIGTQLVERKVFEHLEKLPAQLEMGRMTEKTYRDDVNSILTVWQDEHLFDKPTLGHLDEAFNARERQREQEELERKVAEKRNKRKVVPRSTTDMASKADEQDEMDVDVDEESPAISGRDGADDEDSASGEVEGADGVEASPALAAVPAAVSAAAPEAVVDEVPGETAAARARRLRPKAEDMFASDGE
jgi:U2-associated protein SR140